jgi:hypothetical protein
MKNINITRGILLGVGLFSATTLTIGSAQAAPNRPDARGEHKNDNRGPNNNNSNNRNHNRPEPNRGQGHKPSPAPKPYKPAPVHKPAPAPIYRPAPAPAYHHNNNGYRPAPAPAYRPNYGYNSTLEGRVIKDLNNNGVRLRTSNGQEVRVTFANGEPRQLGTNDVIRVTGSYSGSTFVARNVSIIRNR